MIDIEYSFRGVDIIEVGHWLDKNMPNPPINSDEPQRWKFGGMNDGSGRMGIRFYDDFDATLFLLRWPQKEKQSYEV